MMYQRYRTVVSAARLHDHNELSQLVYNIYVVRKALQCSVSTTNSKISFVLLPTFLSSLATDCHVGP